MSEPLRAGIVGAGFAGSVHARSARLAGAELAGVAASSPERAEAARHRLGARRAFASAEELAASPEVDVVHICAPNHLHLPLTKASLAAGKHVICEKPLALDAAGAAELAAIARESPQVVTVPFVYRYYPTVREARARVLEGRLGEVRLIQGGYLQDWQLDPPVGNWRADRELGGASRAFADIGSHWCDLVEFVSGQRLATLTARTRSAGDGGEQIAVVAFETDAGAAGSVVVSQVSAGHKNQLWFELAGTAESLCFDQERPDALWVGRREAIELVPRGRETLAAEAAAYVTVPAGHPQGYEQCFDAFVAETYAAITGGGPAPGLPGAEDGLRAARLTEAVLTAASRPEWVEVSPQGVRSVRSRRTSSSLDS